MSDESKFNVLVILCFNDFIDAYLNINIPDKEELICSSKNVNQLKRLLDENTYDKYIKIAFSDKSILEYYFVTEYQKSAFVTEYVSRNRIFDDDFSDEEIEYIISNYIEFITSVTNSK